MGCPKLHSMVHKTGLEMNTRVFLIACWRACCVHTWHSLSETRSLITAPTQMMEFWMVHPSATTTLSLITLLMILTLAPSLREMRSHWSEVRHWYDDTNHPRNVQQHNLDLPDTSNAHWVQHASGQWALDCRCLAKRTQGADNGAGYIARRAKTKHPSRNGSSVYICCCVTRRDGINQPPKYPTVGTPSHPLGRGQHTTAHLTMCTAPEHLPHTHCYHPLAAAAQHGALDAALVPQRAVLPKDAAGTDGALAAKRHRRGHHIIKLASLEASQVKTHTWICNLQPSINLLNTSINKNEKETWLIHLRARGSGPDRLHRRGVYIGWA